MTYKPSPWGIEYHALTCREALGGGAAGPGKSLCLLMDPWQQIINEHRRCQLPKNHPDYIEWGQSEGWALFLRRTTPQLEYTLREAKKIFNSAFQQSDLHFSEKTNTFTFPSGFRYEFGHCVDSKDWERYWGKQFSWIGYDELVTFEKEQYDMVNLRLRVKDRLLQKMLKIRAMSNPVVSGDMSGVTVKDPQWVRRYFVDPAPEGRKLLPRRIRMSDGSEEEVTRIYLPARLKDNPDPEFARRYEIEIRAANKPHVANALINADWYVTAASYFGDVWNPRLHICRPFKIPDTWKRFRSMDWGFKVPGCIHWYAMDDEGNIFVEREQTFQDKTDIHVAKMVKEIEQVMGLWRRRRSQITGPADTQLWEERGDSALTKADVFLRAGVPWTKANKGPGSRQGNAMRIHQRLGDHGHGTKTPGLVIFETCKQIIRTLPMVQSTPDNPDEPVDGGDDHWFDSLGYGVSFASHGRAGIPARQTRDEDDEDELERAKGRGRLGYGLG